MSQKNKWLEHAAWCSHHSRYIRSEGVTHRSVGWWPRPWPRRKFLQSSRTCTASSDALLSSPEPTPPQSTRILLVLLRQSCKYSLVQLATNASVANLGFDYITAMHVCDYTTFTNTRFMVTGSHLRVYWRIRHFEQTSVWNSLKHVHEFERQLVIMQKAFGHVRTHFEHQGETWFFLPVLFFSASAVCVRTLNISSARAAWCVK